MFGLKKSIIDIIIKELSKFSEIQEAVIFGSRAKGNFKKGSDIDIAIKGVRINEDIVVQLSRTLNQESPIPHFIDVVHYEQVTNKDLIAHINRVGESIYLT